MCTAFLPKARQDTTKYPSTILYLFPIDCSDNNVQNTNFVGLIFDCTWPSSLLTAVYYFLKIGIYSIRKKPSSRVFSVTLKFRIPTRGSDRFFSARSEQYCCNGVHCRRLQYRWISVITLCLKWFIISRDNTRPV